MKYEYSFVKSYIEKFGFKLISETYVSSLTKMDMVCTNSHNLKLDFTSFKRGRRCAECSRCKPLTIEYVKSEIESIGYTLLSSEYINNKTKLFIECDKKHQFRAPYETFQKGHRCLKCDYNNKSIKYIGINNPNWCSDRDHISLNRKLRSFFGKAWIIKNMKFDKNYEYYLSNPENFHLDHIIPINIFSKITKKFNLDETIIKQIINLTNNLQIISKSENRKKWDVGCIFQASQFLMLNGIKLY